jgi:hypothetical protein
MDETAQHYAYRCLPLTIANMHGWELLCPCTFEALWTGGHSMDAVKIVRLSGAGEIPDSHFGEGVLTFQAGYLFRTEQPYNLYVSGPANVRKDGIAPLTGIVEASWVPFAFTMNWVFTRVGVPIRFEEGEPFCQFFPIHQSLVEEVEPECFHIDADPELKRQYAEWNRSRNEFVRDRKIPGTPAASAGWQRFYHRGVFPDGEPGSTEHRTRLHVRPFADPPAIPAADPADPPALGGACPFHSPVAAPVEEPVAEAGAE